MPAARPRKSAAGSAPGAKKKMHEYRQPRSPQGQVNGKWPQPGLLQLQRRAGYKSQHHPSPRRPVDGRICTVLCLHAKNLIGALPPCLGENAR